MHVSRRVDTFSNPRNNGSKALNTTEGEQFHAFRGGFAMDGSAQCGQMGCRRVGRHMGGTSLKFGGWGLCATCGRESQVQATENKKWMAKKK